MNTLIELENITKSYGDTAVLRDFCLQVSAGEALALVGPSGCGKTTLLRILAGLDIQHTGRLLLGGRDARGIPAHCRDMAPVFQEPTLWSHMTVRENILFPLPPARRRAAEPLLAQVAQGLGLQGLLARWPDEISGGQAKRVSLARALVSGRGILLLDEPLSNIDRDTRDTILHFLHEQVLGRRTVLYVSHDMQEVAALCGRVITL